LIGLDTNVLARYLTEDDPEQSPRAVALVEGALEEGERLFVTQIVLCELVWVLDSVYGYSREEIVSVVRDLLRARQLVIEDLDSARTALDRYFADFLIVERCRAAGCGRVDLFDGSLGKAEEDVFQP
jgi:predicted nucleic-acid-binding protein